MNNSLRIDHIFASSDQYFPKKFDVLKVENKVVSDHFPIMAELELKEWVMIGLPKCNVLIRYLRMIDWCLIIITIINLPMKDKCLVITSGVCLGIWVVVGIFCIAILEGLLVDTVREQAAMLPDTEQLWG